MKIVAISSVWNSSLWLPHSLRWWLPFYDTCVIDSANWTSQDSQWAGNTSPDGTSEIIQNYPDPKGKIRFRELGYYPHGCLAARAELCRRIPKCDWVVVQDVDEFVRRDYLKWIVNNLEGLTKQGYTTISQPVRSFYWQFNLHTVEGFTRWHRYYPGINPWTGRSPYPGKDFNIAREFGQETPSPTEPRFEIFHYSYVPVPAVRIKGAESFDVPRQRYKDWYHNVYSTFDGVNLQEIYDKNQGGVHVFGGMELHDYTGQHPEVLETHLLRYAVYRNGKYFHKETGAEIELEGWWTR
jgi:hypothetical protein